MSDGADSQVGERARSQEFLEDMRSSSWVQAERHAAAAGFWGTFQWIAGGAAAVLAAAASGSAFAAESVTAGVLALGAAGAAALVTALRPGDLTAQHMAAANEFHALHLAAHDVCEFTLADDPPGRRKQVALLADRWTSTSSTSPRVPRFLSRKALELTMSSGSYFPRLGRDRHVPPDAPERG